MTARGASILRLPIILALLLCGAGDALHVAAADPEPKRDSATLVVAHKWDDSVGFYDAASGAVLETIPVGKKPHEMALSRDGQRAYATLYGIDLYTEPGEGGRAIAIVDLQRRAKVGEIDLGRFRRPHGIEVGHRSGLLYVTCDHPASLLVIDPQRRAIETSIELADPQSLSHMVAVTADEKTAFVANSGAATVSVIDLPSKQEVRRISIGGVPMGMALSADGATLFATNRTANGVAVIDAAERKVKRVIEISGQPVRAHLTPDGKWLLVTLIESGEVALVDAKELTLVRRLSIGQRVEGLTVDPSGRFAYASAQADNKVVKFSLDDWKPVLEIKTRTRPDPLILVPGPSDASPPDRPNTTQQGQWRSQIKSALFIPDPLPDLEVQTHGEFEPEPGIVAQRVTYASQFRLRVPAILYLPKEQRQGKVPGVIVVNGHGGDKHSWYAFYSGILYARAGAAVLTFDPIGEGERHRERRSGTRAHDQKLEPREMAQRMGGALVSDVMQAVSYLHSRPEIDSQRIAAMGYSLGSFLTAIAGAVDTRLHACVLVGGGNLDGPQGYWDGSKPMCQGIPYRSLAFLGDRPAALYALHASRGPTLVFNGLADSVVGIPQHGHGEAFFKDLQERTTRLSGKREQVYDFRFVPDVSHRPFFVTRPVAQWLEERLDFPHWTPAVLRDLPETHIGRWATAQGVALDPLYATEEREGGTRALGENVPALSRAALSVFSPEEWEREKSRLVYESWVEAARAKIAN